MFASHQKRLSNSQLSATTGIVVLLSSATSSAAFLEGDWTSLPRAYGTTIKQSGAAGQFSTGYYDEEGVLTSDQVYIVNSVKALPETLSLDNVGDSISFSGSLDIDFYDTAGNYLDSSYNFPYFSFGLLGESSGYYTKSGYRTVAGIFDYDGQVDNGSEDPLEFYDGWHSNHSRTQTKLSTAKTASGNDPSSHWESDTYEFSLDVSLTAEGLLVEQYFAETGDAYIAAGRSEPLSHISSVLLESGYNTDFSVVSLYSSGSMVKVLNMTDADVTFASALAQLIGDYNQNEEIDQGDYSVWADALINGSTVEEVGQWVDGNGNGVIDQGDFSVWADAFIQANNNSPEAAALVAELATLVPEPTSALLLGLASGCTITRRRRK